MVLRGILKIYSKLDFFSKNCQARFVSEVARQRRLKMDLEMKSRENPIALKLDSPEFKNIFTDEVNALYSMFKKYGYKLRIAGGAVRDLLMNIQPTDLDFATTATPTQMKDMFTTESVRMINVNGEKHGTITARINDKENFEVTTLRIDVVTDGRRAEVEFTTDWKLDAGRRDLTFNSMFLGFDGSVYDYFFGYDDLLARRVAFVGNPDTRIKEDYLRILRYFRFYGRIATKADNHEDNTLHVISQNVSGLHQISGERLWMELKKILMGNFSGELLKTMLHVGIGKYIGLPDQPNVAEFDRVWERGRSYNLHPISMLTALLYNFDDAINLHSKLKFSAFERDLAFFLVNNREPKVSVDPLLPYQKMIINTKLKQQDIIVYVKELLNYKNELILLEKINDWQIPKFPLNGLVLKENGVPHGKIMGIVIYKLKDHWSDNEFKTTREELITLIPNILSDLQHSKEK